MTARTETVDTIIIGAGLSGLSAAQTLINSGQTVAVLEARERVGGRLLTKDVEGGSFDLGAQWIGPTQKRINTLCQELGIQTFKTFHRGRTLLELDGKTRSYKSSIPRLSPLALIELQRTIMRIEHWVKKVPSDDALGQPKSKEWDNLTVGEWARRQVWNKDARHLLNAAIRVIFGVDDNELPVLHMLRYANAAGGLMQLCEIENAAQETRLAGGTQQLAQGLANRMTDSIFLNSPATLVRQFDNEVRVGSGEQEFSAGKLIIAIPPALCARINFQPGLTTARRQLIQRFPMGATIKCHALYKETFWRKAGWSGEVVADGNPITVVFDNTSHNGQAALLAFIVGEPARQWSRRPEAERRTKVLDCLARWFGEEAKKPIDFVEKDWATEEWTGGCPIGVPTLGTLSSYGTALKEPEGNIHWAGTETATEWMGFMEGAIQAGERAAQEVLAAAG